MPSYRRKNRSKIQIKEEDIELLKKYEGKLSSQLSLRPSRITYMAAFTVEILEAIQNRQKHKVTLDNNGVEVDATPKTIYLNRQSDRNQCFRRIFKAVVEYFTGYKQSDSELSDSSSRRSFASTLRSRSSARAMGGMKLSMEDILVGIGSERVYFPDETHEEFELLAPPVKYTQHKLPFIKVVLRKTECILLYEQRSLTVAKGTDEGADVEMDNKQYEYLTTGKGKVRRRSESEAQTTKLLVKSRGSNTTPVYFAQRGSYVSYYEMFDTYTALEGGKRTAVWQPNTLRTGTFIERLLDNDNYLYATMVIERLLASNNYEQAQRRVRNMHPPEKLDRNIEYRYTVNILFRYVQPTFEIIRKDKVRKAVSDLSFCHSNSDILAVAYGIYSFSAAVLPITGNVCVWSIKDPEYPERSYSYPVPVVSVKFSPFIPSLLAVGLYDGNVEVRDITKPNDVPLAVTQRTGLTTCEPIIAITWLKQTQTGDLSEIDPFLCLSQDGTVTRYRIINSPFLLGFKQMVLERIEGAPEGLFVKKMEAVKMQSNRHPQGLDFTMHPTMSDIYYLLTDEGCLHKCTTNYTHQYLEVWRTHEGAVNCMDFSPWSPKLFLTCGNDWCIRIWMDGVFKPIITLRDSMAPVHCAYWSRTHSTTILALNRMSLDIWDIRRNILHPVSSTKMDSSFNTLMRFTKCGTCIAVGNERGNTLMCALDDMPFPPHFQYEELESALFSAIATFPDLIIELKSVGYFGYPKKRHL